MEGLGLFVVMVGALGGFALIGWVLVSALLPALPEPTYRDPGANDSGLKTALVFGLWLLVIFALTGTN